MKNNIFFFCYPFCFEKKIIITGRERSVHVLGAQLTALAARSLTPDESKAFVDRLSNDTKSAATTIQATTTLRCLSLVCCALPLLNNAHYSQALSAAVEAAIDASQRSSSAARAELYLVLGLACRSGYMAMEDESGTIKMYTGAENEEEEDDNAANDAEQNKNLKTVNGVLNVLFKALRSDEVSS